MQCTYSKKYPQVHQTGLYREWPFSVNEIEVYCSGYKEIYGQTNNGKIYALNGSAKDASHNDPSISKVEEI